MLSVVDLHAEAGGREILKGVDLTVDQGETCVLFGPNGSGKSTLMSTIMGYSNIAVTSGQIVFKGKDITDMPVDERAKLGIGMMMQRPPNIYGVKLGDLIRETTENRIPCTVERIGGTPTQPVYELKTGGPVEIGCVVLREDLTHGQRVEGFRILGIDEENKVDYALFEGTCIGNKHICELEDPFAVQNPLTGHTNKKLSGVRVQITAARDEVFMREIYITKGKSVCEQK